MRDLQRERLSHLLATAIMELWKKETGSQSAVVIEGTICITSSTGKTTVLQVADRFLSHIQDGASEQRPQSYTTSTPENYRFNGLQVGLLSPPGLPDAPRVEMHNATAMAAFLDNLSPASLVSPVTEYSRSSQDSQSPSMPPPQERAMDVSHSASGREESDSSPDISRTNKEISQTDREEAGKAGSLGKGDRHSTSSLSSRGSTDTGSEDRPLESPRSAHSGYDKPKRLDFDCMDLSQKRERETDAVPNHRPPSEPSYYETKYSDSRTAERTPVSSQLHGLNYQAYRRDSELALSLPQDYTAQVRHVIRQRLLASQPPVAEDDADPGDRDLKENGSAVKRARRDSCHESQTDRSLERESSERNIYRRSNSECNDYPHHIESFVHRRHLSESASCDGEETSRRLPLNPLPPLSISSSVTNFSVATLVAGLPKPPMMPGPLPAFLSHPGLPLLSTPLPSGFRMDPRARMHSDNSLDPRPRVHSEGSTPTSVSPAIYPHSAPPMLGIRDDSFHGGESPELPPDKDASGETRVYKCEFCSKTFLFKSKYHEHLPVHTNARPFQCHLCSRTYKYKYDLRVHLRTHMGIPTKSTVCPFCNAKFESNKQLRLHIRDNHSDKQRVSEEECTQPQDNLPPAL